MKCIPLLLTGLMVSGCANLSPQQQQNLQLELSVAEQIGTDSVQVWCASSGIIYVIAKDISSQSRVTTFLGNNAQAAIDACPMISQATNSNIRVVTGATVPPLTPSNPPASPPAPTTSSSTTPPLPPTNNGS